MLAVRDTPYLVKHPQLWPPGRFADRLNPRTWWICECAGQRMGEEIDLRLACLCNARRSMTAMERH
jgi:hypothetical protein